MKKNKNKKKGFTLIEILVVVIIIGALSSIAVPGYMRSVEKSKAANPMANLSTIAKAQNAYRMGTEHYTNDVGNLDISLKDGANGEDAAGSTFESENFIYRIYGDDNAAATATRKNVSEDKQYELSIDYATNQIYCRPLTNKTCIDLGLDEGQDFSQSAWQETQCSDTQISCYVQEIDGNFAYKVCEQNYNTPYCAYDIYDEYGNQIVHYFCNQQNIQNGFCNTYDAMKETDYSSDQERRCLEIEGLECKNWGPWRIRK